MKDKSIKCIYCGKFISYIEIENNRTGFYFEPDNEFGGEIIEHWHLECKDKYEHHYEVSTI
jgi:hypothetical protein